MIYLIDGNAYINVAVNVTKRMLFNDKSIRDDYYMNDIFNEGEYILKETTRIRFRDFCLSYLISMISPIGNKVDEVHIVFDSRSWRKDYIRSFFTDKAVDTKFEYKSSRKKDNMIRLFFEYFQGTLQPHLSRKAGINFHRVDGMEGDDLIAQLCETTDKDTIIYTVDKDILQLVENKEKYTILVTPKMMTKHKKVYTTSKSDVNEDFFNLSNSDVAGGIDTVVESFKNKGYVNIEIDPYEILLGKIFGGDKSDDIPRLYKMTPSKVKRVVAYLLEKYDGNIFNKIDDVFNETSEDYFIEDCMHKMIEINKISDDKEFLHNLKSQLLLNIKVIRLSTAMIPESIKSKDYDKIHETREYHKFNYSKLIETKNKSVLI
tara:strand:+ start:4692 stop:5816 length:1125 start_codon:yes stop_codon:yes gene_type:complete